MIESDACLVGKVGGRSNRIVQIVADVLVASLVRCADLLLECCSKVLGGFACDIDTVITLFGNVILNDRLDIDVDNKDNQNDNHDLNCIEMQGDGNSDCRFIPDIFLCL